MIGDKKAFRNQDLGLERLVNFVVAKYKPERITLFGSYGTGTRNENSDIDLVIIKETKMRFVDRVVELMQLIRGQFGLEYPVEPLVYTPEEWKYARKINSIFTRTVLSEGIVLYEKE